MKRTTIIKALLLIAIIFSAISCGKDNATNTPPNNNSTADTAYANVTWSSKTVTFNQSDVIKNDSTYELISFGTGNTKAAALKSGDIIFIYGKALRKVSTVNNVGGEIIVETIPCKLNEAITDGEIVWSKNLLFTDDLIKGVQFGSKYPGVQEVNGNDISFSFNIGNGMKGKIKLTMNNTRLDASCSIEKSAGVANIIYSFDGYAQNMKTVGKIKYAGQKLTEFNYQNKNIDGEVTVSLTATGSSKDLLGGIELPFVLLKVPLVIAGIPCFFNVKMLFVINTELASIDASANIKTKFKFNSETGVKYDGTTIGINGSAGPYNMDFLKDSCWVASSVAAGINFGLTFPRLELEIFGNILVPYAHTAFLIGGSFTTGTKPCLTVDCSYIGSVGYDFNFLGLIKFSGSKNLWQWDKNIRK